MFIHVVQKGDTLWQLSSMYGADVSEIAALNGLTSDRLVPGLSLIFPAASLPIRLHKVSSGDTLWQLSMLYQTSVESITAANPGVEPFQLLIGSVLRIPSPIKRLTRLLGFTFPYNQEMVINVLENLGRYLTYLAVVGYSFTEEGYAYEESPVTGIIERSRQLNVIPLLMIRNIGRDGDFSAELAGSVLRDPVYRRNLVRSISNLMVSRGYGGVSIDFEFIPPPQREAFSEFLRELKAEIGNSILHVNVHAKTEDIPTNRIIGAYDYKAIAEASDIVAVMTIDYGYPTGPPNPVSPYNWMEEVIQYSLTEIPAGKLQIALPLYGYDWELPSYSTTARSSLDSQNLAIANWSPIFYVPAARTPGYGYINNGMRHLVWFDDGRSYQEKYGLIDLYKLHGATVWQLSLQAPQHWIIVDRNLTIIKDSFPD
ncbi:LysM peptidoglycan-binding domain-containing protein [Bacillus lacus]|uniref:LysM peptidoglycan-binding domain-containing protein n=1 Tax=Metabacillus lacus TaxID=1983721 RepID=A0A7X2IW04_9BACI|nr:LysM peptidoglycan-binding domain-containing protein [Metabacillus lacus]MRX70770.1 LysM peptidoglycan-binding domain-containing protein [Metabacillus lacus]